MVPWRTFSQSRATSFSVRGLGIGCYSASRPLLMLHSFCPSLDRPRVCCALHGRARGSAENSNRGGDSAIPPLWKNCWRFDRIVEWRDGEEAAELPGLSQPDGRRKMSLCRSALPSRHDIQCILLHRHLRISEYSITYDRHYSSLYRKFMFLKNNI